MASTTASKRPSGLRLDFDTPASKRFCSNAPPTIQTNVPPVSEGCLTPTESSCRRPPVLCTPDLLRFDCLLVSKTALQTALRRTDDRSAQSGPVTVKVFDERDKSTKHAQLLTPNEYLHYRSILSRLSALADEDSSALWSSDCSLFGPFNSQSASSQQFYLCIHGRSYGDLHTHVRDSTTLGEREAAALWNQIVAMTALAHKAGILLRDMKLRKFVFADEKKTILRFDNLDDCYVCPLRDSPPPGELRFSTADMYDDRLLDRKGCPAYVAPELLDLDTSSYSGRPIDVWSLGVLLYLLLIGRYPFYERTPAALFARIRSGFYCIPPKARPDSPTELSAVCRTLIRSILRGAPAERPRAVDLSAHLWTPAQAETTAVTKTKEEDAVVPQV